MNWISVKDRLPEEYHHGEHNTQGGGENKMTEKIKFPRCPFCGDAPFYIEETDEFECRECVIKIHRLIWQQRHLDPRIKELVRAARVLLPKWQEWRDSGGRLERNGHYLWNTKDFYAFADATKAVEDL